MLFHPLSLELDYVLYFQAVLSTRVALELQNFVTCDLTWTCLNWLETWLGTCCYAVWDLRVTWTWQYYYCNQACCEKQERVIGTLSTKDSFLITQYLSDVRARVNRHCRSMVFVLNYMKLVINFRATFPLAHWTHSDNKEPWRTFRKWSRLDSAETWFLTVVKVVCRNLKFLNLTLVNFFCNH